MQFFLKLINYILKEKLQDYSKKVKTLWLRQTRLTQKNNCFKNIKIKGLGNKFQHGIVEQGKNISLFKSDFMIWETRDLEISI